MTIRAIASGYNNTVNVLWLNFRQTINHEIAIMQMDAVAITKTSFS